MILNHGGTFARHPSTIVLIFVVFGCRAEVPPAPAAGLAVFQDSGQLVLVTTESWDATTGTLQRFERVDGNWEGVSDPVPVVVGRSGLGWGTGLHSAQANGPVKQEGDGRAPAGAFSLTGTFGYAEYESTGLPYLQATADVECVDDSASRYYNQVLDRSAVEVDWNSHEEMLRQDELYRLGLMVAHNEAAIAGNGSCIFLHIWRDADATTAGCTAMPASAIEQIAAWPESPNARCWFSCLEASTRG